MLRVLPSLLACLPVPAVVMQHLWRMTSFWLIAQPLAASVYRLHPAPKISLGEPLFDRPLSSQVKYSKAFLQRRNEARSALSGAEDTWITDPSNTDEATLWGEMFILSEKDAGAAKDDTLQKVSALTQGRSRRRSADPAAAAIAGCVDESGGSYQCLHWCFLGCVSVSSTGCGGQMLRFP